MKEKTLENMNPVEFAARKLWSWFNYACGMDACARDAMKTDYMREQEDLKLRKNIRTLIYAELARDD